MPTALDHLILPVNSADESVAFYTRVLGFEDAGKDGPFSVLRVSPTLTLQLSPWGTKGSEHLAFAMERGEFDVVFQRIRNESIPFGDHYDSVGSMKGPGDESGSRGMGKSIYFFDPNKHLLEIRYYERPQ